MFAAIARNSDGLATCLDGGECRDLVFDCTPIHISESWSEVDRKRLELVRETVFYDIEFPSGSSANYCLNDSLCYSQGSRKQARLLGGPANGLYRTATAVINAYILSNRGTATGSGKGKKTKTAAGNACDNPKVEAPTSFLTLDLADSNFFKFKESAVAKEKKVQLESLLAGLEMIQNLKAQSRCQDFDFDSESINEGKRAELRKMLLFSEEEPVLDEFRKGTPSSAMAASDPPKGREREFRFIKCVVNGIPHGFVPVALLLLRLLLRPQDDCSLRDLMRPDAQFNPEFTRLQLTLKAACLVQCLMSNKFPMRQIMKLQTAKEILRHHNSNSKSPLSKQLIDQTNHNTCLPAVSQLIDVDPMVLEIAFAVEEFDRIVGAQVGPRPPLQAGTTPFFRQNFTDKVYFF